MSRGLAAALATLFVWPMFALAQAPKAGIVTTLEGNVTARRVAFPSPVPLKFKDDVFLQDTITTGDNALARMLLGGKAVVTVRERSVLTITEVPGRSTIELESGKFALAVAREKMRAGEEIQIRTPNAVAGVRGTVVITEVNRQSAQASGPPPSVVTNFYVLRGAISIQPLNQPGAPLSVGTLQSARIAGATPGNVAPIPPEQIGQIIAGLQPTGQKLGGDAAKDQVKGQQVQTAIVLVGALTGEQEALATMLPSTLLASTLSRVDIPINVFTQQPLVDACQGATSGSGCATLTASLESSSVSSTSTTTTTTTPPPPCAGCVRLSHGSFNFSGSAFQSFSGTFVSTSPLELLGIDTSLVTHSGSLSFIELLSGANVTLAGPLAALLNSTISTTGTFLSIAGLLTNTSTSSLIILDPSTIATGDALLAMNGGTLTLAGPLLTDTGGTLGIGQEFLRMASSTLTSTTTDALVQLNGTTIATNLNGGSAAAFNMINSTMTLAGPFVAATGLVTSGHSSVPLFLIDQASTLTSSGTSPFAQLTATTLRFDGSAEVDLLKVANASSASLAGPVLSLESSTLSVARDLVRAESGSAFVLNGNLVSLGNSSTLQVGGALARAVSNGLVLVTGTAFGPVGAGNTVAYGTSLFPDANIFGVPVRRDSGGFVSLGPLQVLPLSGVAFMADGTGSLVTINPMLLPSGPFLTFTGSVPLGGSVIASFGIGALAMPPSGPLTNVLNTTIVAQEDPLQSGSGLGQGIAQLAGPAIRLFGATMNGGSGSSPLISVSSVSLALAGSLLEIISSNLDNSGGTGPLLSVGGSPPALLKTYGTAPMILVSSSSVLFNSPIVSLSGSAGADSAIIALSAPLLSASGSSIQAGSPLIDVHPGTIIGSTTLPMIQLAGGRADAILTAFINVTGSSDADPNSAVISLAGPLLRADSTILTSAGDFILVNPGTLRSTTTQALVQLSGSSLVTGQNFMTLGCGDTCQSNAFLAGPLLEAVNSTLNIGGRLLFVSAFDSQLLSTSTNSFVKIAGGGPHQLASSFGPVFDLGGANTTLETDPDAPANLTVGTDQPLRVGGILFEASGTTISSGSASNAPFISVDQALLAASAPLVKLTSSSMTHAGDLVGLVNGAKVTGNLQSDALVKLDASTLTVNNGYFFGLKGGSSLSVVGNLLSLTNGSSVTINNGALVTVVDGGSSGSFFKLTGGSLVVFGSGSNSLTINGTAATNTIGGVPILLTGGAVAGQVQVAPGFTPFVGGAPGGTGAVLVVNGPNSKVVLRP